jgi:hypothetical protein
MSPFPLGLSLVTGAANILTFAVGAYLTCFAFEQLRKATDYKSFY